MDKNLDWKQKIVVLVMSTLLVTMLGCAAFMDGLTPAYIDPNAIEYSGEAPKIFTPYTSIWDLQRVKRGIDRSHFENQLALARELEDDVAKYS